MSQVLVAKQKRSEYLVFQDLYFGQKPISVMTSVTEAVCYVCKKGLNDGLSITAKTSGKKINLFCDMHFPR